MAPLHRAWAVAGLVIAISGPCPPLAAFPWRPPLDRHGDPLPAGAAARLGTAQLRAGVASLQFSADGRTLVGLTPDGVVRVWDAADGRLRQTSRDAVGPGRTVPVRWARSADGRTLACRRGETIELFDLPSGDRLPVRPLGNRKGIEHLAVSDDRRWVFFSDRVGPQEAGLGGMSPPIFDLVVWDTTTGEARGLARDPGQVTGVALSPDGKRAVMSGTAATGFFAGATKVWDTASGKLLWQDSNYRAHQCHFTPDGKYLIASPGFAATWRAWEADTGKPSRTLRPPADLHFAWVFAVSPDGGSLLVTDMPDYVVWDLKAGKVRHRWPGAGMTGRGTFAPDGRSVVTYDTTLRRWDLATGKNLYADMFGLGHTAPVHRLFFHPDGTQLVSLGEDWTARVWDTGTSRLLRTIRIETPAPDAWALTPDGGTLVGVDDRMVVHRWPLAAGGSPETAYLRDARQRGLGLGTKDARVSPDGTLVLLISAGPGPDAVTRHAFSFWDLTTGRLVRWGEDPGREFHGNDARLAPDGRVAVTTTAVFDTRTGTSHALPRAPVGGGKAPVFSADGRLTAAGGMRAWEVSTGRVLTDLPRGGGTPGIVAFAPDGRRVAAVATDRLSVWDVGSRTVVAEWPMPSPLSGGVIFSPDGQTVATGHADGTILLWRIPAPTPADRWSAAEGAGLWQDLSHENPANGYPAVWKLAERPADAVRLLRDKYLLIAGAAADEFAKLIAGLDSPKFAEREAASKRLAELGRAAERPLRQALGAKPSPEQARRIEALLAALDPPAVRPLGEDLRAVRAVAALEACGTADARRLLAEWAERGTPPRLAHEAARAVERLKWVPVRPQTLRP